MRVWLIDHIFDGAPPGTSPTFARLGLIDEYVFLLHPVAFGHGKRVFPDRMDLELVNSKTYPSGVVRLRYGPRNNRSDTK